MRKVIILSDFTKGFICATVGITIAASVSDIISTATELLKAFLGSKIVKYNQDIDSAISPPPQETRAIGFNTTFEQEEDEEYVDD